VPHGKVADGPGQTRGEFGYGGSYDSDAETLQATVAPDAPRKFLTGKGLAQPGDVASFKVFVVLETGDERGSEVLTVQRPATPATAKPPGTLPDRTNGSLPVGSSVLNA